MASLALTQNSGWLVKLDGGLVLHQDLSPSSPYSTRPRQIYTGHFIKEVRQWEDLLVARTRNSDLLLARLELLAEEEAWQPLLVCAETETAQLAVLGFDISQAGELWVVGRGVREVTTQFLLTSSLLPPASVLLSPVPSSSRPADCGPPVESPPRLHLPPVQAGHLLPGLLQEGRRPTLATYCSS